MFCSQCGKKLPDQAKFCSGCGTKTKFFKELEEQKKEELKEEKVEEIKEEPKEEKIEEVKEEKIEVPVTPNTIEVKTEPVKKKKTPVLPIVLISCISVVVLVILAGVGIALTRSVGGNGRVVMIYMVGSNLESRSGLASRDLQDLDYDKLKANNTKVILIAGGTTSWKNNYIDVNETSIYSLEQNGFQKIDARPKTNMGTADNLSYFLKYVYTHYKANKYDFIYWNHGGAVDGSEYDDLTNDHLMLQEMANAFENSPFKHKKLEVISFRTCLNSTIEVANIYKKYANYLVASEEVTIGSQADSAIRFLNDVTMSDSGIEYGKKQIETYKDVVSNTCNYSSYTKKEDNYCIDSTYSITDLSKIDKVSKELNTFSKDLNNKVQTNYKEYAKLRANMKQYGSDEPAYDMVDLYDLTEKFDRYSSNGKNVRSAIEDAVVYNWSNTNHSHGLSIYFPYNNQVFLNGYNTISTSNDYTKLITNFYKVKSNTRVKSYDDFSISSDNTFSKKKKKSKKKDVEYELTDEQIDNMTKAGYLVFIDTKDGYFQVVHSGSDVTVEGNKLKVSIKDRLLKIRDKEYKDDSTWLLTIEDKVTDDYIDLKTFVYLSDTTDMMFGRVDPATAIIRIDKAHPNGYIKALYTNLDGKSSEKVDNFNVFSPAGTKLTDYNFITVASSRYKLLDENGNYNPNWDQTSNNSIQGTIHRTNMAKFTREDFSDDYDYYIVFRVLDIANNEYNSKPIKIN